MTEHDGTGEIQAATGPSTRWWCAAGTWSHSDPPPGFNVHVLKTATVNPRHDPAAFVLRSLPDSGCLNRVGLRNAGIVQQLASLPTVPGDRAVSVLGFDRGEWGLLARHVEDAGEPILELNLSCPNIVFGHEGVTPDATYVAVTEARHRYTGRLGAKLPPTVSVEVAAACVDAGADYLALCNTLGTPAGGLSGRPLRALALDCIARCAHANLGVPIVGGGGILAREDARLYLAAGASEVFVGTANLFAGAAPEPGRRPKPGLAVEHLEPRR